MAIGEIIVIVHKRIDRLLDGQRRGSHYCCLLPRVDDQYTVGRMMRPAVKLTNRMVDDETLASLEELQKTGTR